MDYHYSVDGNLLFKYDMLNHTITSYVYDDLGRLIQETDGNRTSSFTYDTRGNRIKETVTGDESYVMTNTYDANNRLTKRRKLESNTAEDTFYYYDANGNQTFKQTQSYAQGGIMNIDAGDYTGGTVESFQYDLQNRLVGYQNANTTASYTYGVNGLRKSKTVNGITTDFVWNGSNLAAEMSGGAITNLYNYGIDGITTQTTSSGNTSLYLKNAHGDVIGLTDMNGNVSAQYAYDAFGNQLSDNTTNTNPFRYCGEYYDAETNNIYLRARYYDTATGRFISEDPVKDGLNWYNYCAGNPVVYKDPSGLKIILYGEDAERAAIMGYLQELSHDILYVEALDDGRYEVKAQLISSAKYQVGTNMIRRLINNSKECKIQLTDDVVSKASMDDEKAAQTLGEGSGGTISLSTKSVKVKVAGVFGTKKETMPKYIELGHELIHVLRAMGGYKKPNGEAGMIMENNNLHGDLKETWDNREEYETTGLSYYTLDGNKFIDAGTWVTTENALRREHGLKERVGYRRE